MTPQNLPRTEDWKTRFRETFTPNVLLESWIETELIRERLRADGLQEELDDILASYRGIINEACADGIAYSSADERQHCSCVPDLRKGLQTATTRAEEAMEEASRLRGQETLLRIDLAATQAKLSDAEEILRTHKGDSR